MVNSQVGAAAEQPPLIGHSCDKRCVISDCPQYREYYDWTSGGDSTAADHRNGPADAAASPPLSHSPPTPRAKESRGEEPLSDSKRRPDAATAEEATEPGHDSPGPNDTGGGQGTNKAGSRIIGADSGNCILGGTDPDAGSGRPSEYEYTELDYMEELL